MKFLVTTIGGSIIASKLEIKDDQLITDDDIISLQYVGSIDIMSVDEVIYLEKCNNLYPEGYKSRWDK